jgi:hypothetical protein
VAPVDAAGIGGREAVSEASRGRQVLRRDWSGVCDELLAHYAAVIGAHADRPERAA